MEQLISVNRSAVCVPGFRACLSHSNSCPTRDDPGRSRCNSSGHYVRDIPNEIDLTQSIVMPCNASPFKCFIISLVSTTFTSVWPSFTKMSSPVKNSSPLLNHFELMSTTVSLSTDKQFFPRTRISENSIRISCLSVLCFQKRMNIEIYTILPEIEICCWTNIFKTFYH